MRGRRARDEEQEDPAASHSDFSPVSWVFSFRSSSAACFWSEHEFGLKMMKLCRPWIILRFANVMRKCVVDEGSVNKPINVLFWPGLQHRWTLNEALKASVMLPAALMSEHKDHWQDGNIMRAAGVHQLLTGCLLTNLHDGLSAKGPNHLQLDRSSWRFRHIGHVLWTSRRKFFFRIVSIT